ncbi:MAG: hypothetical protein CBC72_002660 [Gammaproteobacteria bacterium TMED112]|nr:MAG: hypothetical protein CBC72_002660 [Gammaproteobacteria bacterium TMED112]|tara:strand:- start:8514 stop:9233 length:720 start_codon:yes stop_codon:yes gene_type:complete
MKFKPLNYIRYLIEFVIIITGVLLSFYLDDLRQLGEKESYKDTLIEELLITSEEDLKQIEKITKDLIVVQTNIAEILADIEDGKKDLNDNEVAEKYLFITQKMSVSFFPQNGTFNQLISTGSIELIDSKKFRRVLLNNYTHYYDRNSANNRTLDDLYLAFGANIDPNITVTSTEQDDASFIYSDMIVSSYDIDQKFYLSNTFKAYLLTAQSMVGKNIDMLQIFSESYTEIIALANKEIS